MSLTSASTAARRRRADTLLARYFVAVRGTGCVATKVALQYPAPSTGVALTAWKSARTPSTALD